MQQNTVQQPRNHSFENQVKGDRQDVLRCLLRKCVELEHFEDASVVREEISRLPPGEGEGDHPKAVADNIIDRFTPQECLLIARRILDATYNNLKTRCGGFAEWINCSLSQLRAVSDALQGRGSPCT